MEHLPEGRKKRWPGIRNQSKSPHPKVEYSWDESWFSAVKRLPWYHPDCRHPRQWRETHLIALKGCDHSFQFMCCMGTDHLSYLFPPGNFLRTAAHDAVLREQAPSELTPTIGSLQVAIPHTIFAQRGTGIFVCHVCIKNNIVYACLSTVHDSFLFCQKRAQSGHNQFVIFRLGQSGDSDCAYDSHAANKQWKRTAVCRIFAFR